MILVTCSQCHTSFKVEPQNIREKGTRVRCSICGHIFRIYRNKESKAISTHSDNKKDVSIQSESPLTDQKQKELAHKSWFSFLRKQKQKTKTEAPHRKKYIPFRTKLIYFGVILIGFISVIVVPIELHRPLKTLYELIDNAKNLVGAVQAAFDSSEIDRMNRFALKIIDSPPDTQSIPEIYYSIAFNMLLIEKEILPEDQIVDVIKTIEYFSKNPFEYAQLIQAGQFWKDQFELEAGIEDILRRSKTILMKAKENAAEAGFILSEIMIMIDSGKKEGFFKENIAYVMESVSWSGAPTYIGQSYQVPPDVEYWRQTALLGQEGYGHNPISDPNRWYLPRFDEDEWGTWFSVWLTKKSESGFNIFSIDFNANRVKKLMFMIAEIVVVVILILGIIVFWLTKWLSNLVTRPIMELTKGAAEVAKGNYDYTVPVFKDDEFGELTKQFNLMTIGQKERLNLMNTLEKFLSKELAEKAAKDGIVLGGQKTDCTIMFTDFAGFSTITRKMTAVEAVNALNSYYDGLIPIIKKYGGFPDKYIGDAIVALFGAPIKLEDHAERAVACAIEMQWKMREINKKRRKEGKTVFEMRIGLNTGEVIAGAIGCDMKLEYTSIGEATNLANRMESICEIGHIMIAEGTYNAIKDIFFTGVDIELTPQSVKVKGYPAPVATFRIHVDNLFIDKNQDSQVSPKSFYIYKYVDHKIKYKPEEVRDGRVRRVSKYIKPPDVTL